MRVYRVHLYQNAAIYKMEHPGRMSHHSCLTIAPQPAHEHPQRTRPSYAVSHPADARNRALGGAQHSRKRIRSTSKSWETCKSWEKVTSPKEL